MAPKRKGNRGGKGGNDASGTTQVDAPSGHQHSPFDEPRRSPEAKTPGSVQVQASPARGRSVELEVARTSVPPSPRDVPATVAAPAPVVIEEVKESHPERPLSDLAEPRTSAVEDANHADLATPTNASMHDRMMHVVVVNSPGASAISPCSTLPATPQAETVAAHDACVAQRFPKILVEAAIIVRALLIVVLAYSAVVASAAWLYVSTRKPSVAKRLTAKAFAIKSQAEEIFETHLRRRVQPLATRALDKARQIDSLKLHGKGEEHIWSFVRAVQTEFAFAQRQ